MSVPSADNQAGRILDNNRVRSCILSIASTTGALCALAGDPLFPSDNAAFRADVPSRIADSLLGIAVEVIEKLLDICDELDLVLTRCIFQKVILNNSKYPAALCKVRWVF
jgi:hypothetical protein